MYLGIITAPAEERRLASHLPPSSPHFISLHLWIQLHLHTPHPFVFLSFSPGSPFFSDSLFHHLFPSLSCYFFLSHPSLQLLSKLNTPLSALTSSPSAVSPLFISLLLCLSLSNLLASFKLCCAAALERWREGEVNREGKSEWNVKTGSVNPYCLISVIWNQYMFAVKTY